MRLRRETGDFSIDVTNILDGAIVLPKNLSKEDLIGCIVTKGTTVEVIVKATSSLSTSSLSSTEITLVTLNSEYRYNPESGELSNSTGSSAEIH